jgi:hypothetical protein
VKEETKKNEREDRNKDVRISEEIWSLKLFLKQNKTKEKINFIGLSKIREGDFDMQRFPSKRIFGKKN